MDQFTNSFVWPEYNLTLVLTPRVGSTSIKRAILGYDTSYHKNTYMDSKRVDQPTCFELAKKKGHHTICTVRDPIDRFVSVWKGLVRDRDWKNFNLIGATRNTPLMDFAKMVASNENGINDIHVRPTSLYHPKNSMLLKYEYLEQEWGMYIRDLSLPFSDIDWKEHYTIPIEYDRKELMDILYNLYKNDLGWKND